MTQKLNTDLTNTNTIIEHSVEILIMLIVAFILGYLFKTIISKKKSMKENSQSSKEITNLEMKPTPQFEDVTSISPENSTNQNSINSTTFNFSDVQYENDINSKNIFYENINSEEIIDKINTNQVSNTTNLESGSIIKITGKENYANLFHRNLQNFNEEQNGISPIKFELDNSPTKELANTNSQLQELKQKNLILEDHLKIKSSEIIELNKQLNILSEKQASLKNQRQLEENSALEMINQLTTQLNKAQSEVNHFQQQLENIQVEHLENISEVRFQLEQQQQQQLEQAEKIISELNQKLEQSMLSSCDNQKKYETEIYNIKKQSDDLARAFDAAIQNWFTNRQELESALKIRETEIAKLNQDINKIWQQNKEELDTQIAQVANLQNKLVLVIEEANRKSSEYESKFNSAIENKEAIINNLYNQLSSKEEELNQLYSKINLFNSNEISNNYQNSNANTNNTSGQHITVTSTQVNGNLL